MDDSETWEVTPAENGVRLDRFLTERTGRSRRDARELLRLGRVRVDDRLVREEDKGRRLTAGSTVHLDGDPAQLERLEARSDLPLCVLAEGEGWLAVDKPAGQPVHPLRADETDTLLHAVLARFPSVEGVGEGGLRSGVVHRLDVDTSGVQLFATRPPDWQRLRGAFRDHRVDKVYRALVHGVPDDHGEAKLWLSVVQHRPARVRVVGPGRDDARECGLRWRRLEILGEHCLLELRPDTGFLHQIRAMMSHLGHPLVGDPRYGAPATELAARHMLHAFSVRVDEIDVSAPEPEDFRRTWRALV